MAQAAPSHAQLTGAGMPILSAEELVGGDDHHLLFGMTLAAGDFDGDGIDDLAIGAPWAPVNDKVEAGRVYVLYSSLAGGFDPREPLPRSVSSQLLHQNVLGVGDVAEANDEFGAALAVADLNRDGYDDLIVGAPGETLGAHAATGLVHVFPGASVGLLADMEQTYHHGLLGGSIATGARFGASLTTGDFDRDDHADLAVGLPGATVDGKTGAGAVLTVLGSATYLDPTTATTFSQADLGAQNGVDEAEAYDGFGFALAAGDFNDDGYEDLVVSAPFEDLRNSEGQDGGVVHLMYGSVAGILAESNAREIAPDGDGSFYGTALAVGDADGDGLSDLVVSAPFYSFIDDDEEGMLYLHRQGKGLPLFLIGHQFITKTDAGSSIQPNDHAGHSVVMGDMNADGMDDIVFSSQAPGTGAGSVSIVFGHGSGYQPGVTVYQGTAGIAGVTEDHDSFGWSLAIGNFAGDGPMLAVGVPGEDYKAYTNNGIVQFLDRPRPIFADGFESGTTASWN